MKIIATSDTHNQHDDLIVPDCDLFIHSGDATWKGTVREIEGFAQWLSEVPARHKVFVPGNHDYGFQTARDRDLCRQLIEDAGAVLLVGESAEVAGIRFWGSPWTPWFHDWAFNFPEYDLGIHEVARAHWEMVPEDTQFLVTHGPPYQILDMTRRGQPVGCQALADIIADRNIVYHQFGHIHEDAGALEIDGVLYVNASALNCHHEFKNPMYHLEWDGSKVHHVGILPTK